jgi:hypothetical protein
LAQEKYPCNWQAREAIFSDDLTGRFITGLNLLIDGTKQRIQNKP